ncbi:MAG: hypothetical protein HC868_14235, partial [Sphingomonadales bacterium]|nr:hypothetical protein [Sphingomonadales bacterium]
MRWKWRQPPHAPAAAATISILPGFGTHIWPTRPPGGTPEQVAKAEKVFDYTRASLAEKIAKEENFCTEAKTKEVKASLTKNL